MVIFNNFETMFMSKNTFLSFIFCISILIVRSLFKNIHQLKHPQNATSTEHQARKTGIKVFFNYITSA